jgi:hypothetical protein
MTRLDMHTFLYLFKKCVKCVITNCKVCETNYARKNAQVVTNVQKTCSNAVPTTCQQNVFALLVPSLLTSANGLLTTCYKVVELSSLVASCSNNLLSSCNSTICQQVVSDKLVAT